ncbi:23S rRNA (adenine(2030)-N(6))-methyltransferase RlmJ [Glaciecola sp. XM2]|uniref:23S rRNA (adenine(2030)-N(6))-methyltransferase RlmJ n=1 Tax=Glaciecola sp. XM2 TaxID=1914931 RepID=UPI001BDE6EE6|nr:23S rRNA (adenine(2030)-N(6))-methyltransferase RlmJ [Glaciecola sp. XM2]MBT1449537.1 23S rRNA (adenine(2030)-N(6))-methyltransferase RlmJ [Glaciecola sp. XM2]
MLSYQHAFHAGNHADVLKHLVLVGILKCLKKKDKPYFVLDTHAGEGRYDLAQAPENADETAFSRLLQGEFDPDSIVHDYLSLLKPLQSQNIYPGSPTLIAQYSRATDTLHFNEVAAKMSARLKQNMRGFNVHSHQRDAFEVLNALLPPTPKRGLVLIDPPYEQSSEYDSVAKAMQQALHKWPSGVYAIWYPLLSPQRINRKSAEVENSPKAHLSEKMIEAIAQSNRVNCNGGMLDIQFAVSAPSTQIGMFGSGVCIVNPPYMLATELEKVLETLGRYVKCDDNTLSSVQWRVAAK